MLKNSFLEIKNRYPIESTKSFKGNTVADFIRHEFPGIVKSYFPKYKSFIWDGSPGKGRLADAPWLAIFNPLVTDTAQKGYYPVFLFSNSLNSVYLSLNQGMADLSAMLDLYNLAFYRGGTSEFDTDLPNSDQTQDEDLAEKKRMRVHLTADRNPKLVRRVKEIHGYTCEICGFNFEDNYVSLGKDFIEAHHLTPFSKLPEDKVINLSPETDFAVVCSNCHSMLHRKGAPETINEFKELYKNRCS